MYIYRETWIMHAILWCSESWDCNKDQYDKTKFLVVKTEPLLSEYGTKSSTDASQEFRHLLKSPTDLSRGLRSWRMWLFDKSNLGAPENALAESESTLVRPSGVWEHLEVLRRTGEVTRSLWEDCLLLLDQLGFCWWGWQPLGNHHLACSNSSRW
jgi:hypothetical protein